MMLKKAFSLQPQPRRGVCWEGLVQEPRFWALTVMIGSWAAVEVHPRPDQYSSTYPVGYEEQGIASWYGSGFQENRTASGERFDKSQLTAHRTLAMGGARSIAEQWTTHHRSF